MGSCCGHQLQCKGSADEGKSLLNAAGNTDTNRKQTSTENNKEDEHKDAAYEERNLKIRSQLDMAMKIEPCGVEEDLNESSPETDISYADDPIHENHTCKNQNGDSETKKGCVESKECPIPDHIKSFATSVDACVQQAGNAPLQDLLHDPASVHGEALFPTGTDVWSHKTGHECKDEKSPTSGSGHFETPFLLLEVQQDLKDTQGEAGLCENVPHLNVTRTPGHAALLQTHSGNAHMMDLGVIAPVTDGKSQERGSIGQDSLLEPAVKLLNAVTSSETTGVDEQNCIVNCVSELQAPKLEEQVETCESYSGEEDLNRPVDLQEVPSLGDLVTEETEQQKSRSEEGIEEEKEEGTSAEETQASVRGKEQNSLPDVQAQVPEEAKDVDADPSTEVTAETLAAESEDISEEDLYRGEDEIIQENIKKMELLSQVASPEVQDKCSVKAEVNVLTYSQREWKGNTAKCTLIRKGYEVVAQNFGSLRRVRGDNYCALRATLFQVLTQIEELPAWIQEEDLTLFAFLLPAYPHHNLRTCLG
uniref:OTU deubiquitinase with linear linkage specificity n=1 Tax=Paramormyrops kingsleyae TaxID=1676925 RepID=A0A3B3TE63_9TELE